MSRFYDKKYKNFRAPYAIESRWGLGDGTTTTLEMGWIVSSMGAFSRNTAGAKAKIYGGATDTAAGTGALTVDIHGLDGNFDPVVEEGYVMAGGSPGNSTKDFIWINDVIVKTAGSGGENEAVLRAFDTSGTKGYGTVPIGANRMACPMYCIPRGKEGYVVRWGGNYKSVTAATTVTLHLAYYNGTAGTIPLTKDIITLHGDGDTSLVKEIEPIRIPEKSVVCVLAQSSAISQTYNSGFDLIVVDKPRS